MSLGTPNGSPNQGMDRVQLCGRLVATVQGTRVDDGMLEPAGRLLFAFLVLQRFTPVDVQRLVETLSETDALADGESQVERQLRRLRRSLRQALLIDPYIQLRLKPDAFVDVETAAEAVHRAEAAIARQEWTVAWPAARIALHTTNRPFLPGARGSWVESERRRLGEINLRALECVAATGIGLGGTELISSERAAQTLVERQPLRESGYRYLMIAMARRGRLPEAIHTYTQYCDRLRESVGIAPSAEMQVLRRQLTEGAAHAPSQAEDSCIRTFMFTDICDSTALIGTIGDHAWRHLRQWHDRLVDQVVNECNGEILDRAGDGVFVAFSRTGDAVSCATKLQRQLAAHRVEHGFAPAVRIGIHADRVLSSGGKYAGRGVHVAARVAALAGPNEIILTSATADDSKTPLHQKRQVLLKGIAESVEVGMVPWNNP